MVPALWMMYSQARIASKSRPAPIMSRSLRSAASMKSGCGRTELMGRLGLVRPVRHGIGRVMPGVLKRDFSLLDPHCRRGADASVVPQKAPLGIHDVNLLLVARDDVLDR